MADNISDSRPLEPWFAFVCSRIRAMSCFPVCLWRTRPRPPALCLLPLLLTPPFPRASAMHLTPTPRHEPANPPGQSVLTRVTICTGGEYSAACNNLTLANLLLQKSLEIQDVTLRSCGVPHGAMMACPIAVLSCPPARGVLRLRDWHAAGCRLWSNCLRLLRRSRVSACSRLATRLPLSCRWERNILAAAIACISNL